MRLQVAFDPQPFRRSFEAGESAGLCKHKEMVALSCRGILYEKPGIARLNEGIELIVIGCWLIN